MRKLLLFFIALLATGVKAQQSNAVTPPLALAILAANDYITQAEQHVNANQYQLATIAYNNAAKLFRYNNKLNDYSHTLLKLSDAHLKLNNLNSAEHIVLNQALKTYAKLGNKQGQINAYNQLAKIYIAADKLPQAFWFYSQQGLLATQTNNKSAYIDALIGMANVKNLKEEYDLASADLDKAEYLALQQNITSFAQQILILRNQIAAIQNQD